MKEDVPFAADVLSWKIGVRKICLVKGHWSHLYPQPEVKVGDTGPGPGDYNPKPEASAAFKRALTATIWPDKTHMSMAAEIKKKMRKTRMIEVDEIAPLPEQVISPHS